MIVYVGAQTGPGKGEGISVFRLDEESGALTHLQTVPAENPTFVALHPSGKYLYAATRTMGSAGPDGGPPRSSVEAYAIDPGSHTLTFLNRQPSGGGSPAHVSVHPSGKAVYAANYGSGHVASLPLGEDGRLAEPKFVIRHEGYGGFAAPGPVARRQEGPHAHFITPDPTGERVLSCDLGCDRVFVYRADPEAGTLTPNDPPYAQVSSGAGPRHLYFHPSGRFVFVNNEIDCTLSAFAYEPDRGALRVVDTRSTLPEDVSIESVGNSTAQTVVHPNGRFVYVSNRGHDSIAIFGIDQERGKLTPLGHESTQGKTPRNFNIDPSGRLLLAANQDSGTIVSFAIDGESGSLSPLGQVAQSAGAVCVVFAAER
jgi:6-phosphogluconolactonase